MSYWQHIPVCLSSTNPFKKLILIESVTNPFFLIDPNGMFLNSEIKRQNNMFLPASSFPVISTLIVDSYFSSSKATNLKLWLWLVLEYKISKIPWFSAFSSSLQLSSSLYLMNLLARFVSFMGTNLELKLPLLLLENSLSFLQFYIGEWFI